MHSYRLSSYRLYRLLLYRFSSLYSVIRFHHFFIVIRLHHFFIHTFSPLFIILSLLCVCITLQYIVIRFHHFLIVILSSCSLIWVILTCYYISSLYIVIRFHSISVFIIHIGYHHIGLLDYHYIVFSSPPYIVIRRENYSTRISVALQVQYTHTRCCNDVS